jgi:hypothetical protein
MAKPYGLSLGLTADGNLRAGVNHPSRAEDAIWNAVEEAIDAGMTPERFKLEAAQAWEETLHSRAKDAAEELSR